MNFSKYKSPQKGAGKKVAEIFQSTRKKQPSDRLVQIISEVGQPEIKETPKKDERAAKEAGV